MMNVIFEDYGNKKTVVKDVSNVAVSSEQDGVVIEPSNHSEAWKLLSKAGFTVVMEGRTLRVSCKSVFCW